MNEMVYNFWLQTTLPILYLGCKVLKMEFYPDTKTLTVSKYNEQTGWTAKMVYFEGNLNSISEMAKFTVSMTLTNMLTAK
jgi:hypothetical protein